MLKRLITISALFAGSCQPASALEINLGASHFTPHGDGIWYQEPFPHTLHMDSLSLGIRADSAPSGNWSFGGGYQYLGRVASHALATASDADYATKACGGKVCYPLSTWDGKGDVQGIFGVATRHFGDWSAEAGLYAYRPTWEVDIPDWRQCQDCPPHPLHVSHNPKWQLGPVVGLAYRQDAWTFRFSVWQTASQGDEWTSLYHNATYNLAIGYTF